MGPTVWRLMTTKGLWQVFVAGLVFLVASHAAAQSKQPGAAPIAGSSAEPAAIAPFLPSEDLWPRTVALQSADAATRPRPAISEQDLARLKQQFASYAERSANVDASASDRTRAAIAASIAAQQMGQWEDAAAFAGSAVSFADTLWTTDMDMATRAYLVVARLHFHRSSLLEAGRWLTMARAFRQASRTTLGQLHYEYLERNSAFTELEMLRIALITSINCQGLKDLEEKYYKQYTDFVEIFPSARIDALKSQSPEMSDRKWMRYYDFETVLERHPANQCYFVLFSHDVDASGRPENVVFFASFGDRSTQEAILRAVLAARWASGPPARRIYSSARVINGVFQVETTFP
jgi:hypothetical protein